MKTSCDKRVLMFFCLMFVRECSGAKAQQATEAEIDLGSQTAKNGFRNEDEIRDKFNNWKTDKDAQAWLRAMKHTIDNVVHVTAVKPHGYKADVEVTVKTKKSTSIERLSIKLVSSKNGFNQIDKRWIDTYAEMWKMPADVVKSMKYFVGETPPFKEGRHKERMYLNELSEEAQAAVLDFFRQRKTEIVSDLLAGDGEHSANWFMVTVKADKQQKWLIRSTSDAVKFFGEGDVVMTRAGNLKLGRIGVQRKGGDNGRKTAQMLQFKINPVQLFDAK